MFEVSKINYIQYTTKRMHFLIIESARLFNMTINTFISIQNTYLQNKSNYVFECKKLEKGKFTTLINEMGELVPVVKTNITQH